MPNREFAVNQASGGAKSVRFRRILWDQRYLMILVIPVVIWMIIFNYLPMLGLVISFKDYNPYLGPLKGFTDSPWVGLANFREALSDKYFLYSFRNTVFYSLMNLIIGFPIPIIFAILLNEISNSGFKRFVQTVSYLPNFISWVFVIGFMDIFFSVDDGMVNSLLLKLHLINAPIAFMASPGFVAPIVILTQVWKSFGWNSIIYIAAITSIDPSLYEAAMVDGANRFTRIWNITLPSIKPTIVILLIFNIGGLISANFGFFEQMYLMTNPIIQDVTEIIDTYTYRMGILSSRYSYATAVGLFRSVVAVMLLVSANFASKKLTGESLY
jgi:putative aldouronate transport system permease protein